MKQTIKMYLQISPSDYKLRELDFCIGTAFLSIELFCTNSQSFEHIDELFGNTLV